jgi:ring-1,2-phenylacetyl-CoA epoxidase subunit PaaD
MHTIEADIYTSLAAHGYSNIRVTSVLAPAWTTDWISSNGKLKLEKYGIAPPGPVEDNHPSGRVLRPHTRCPHCGSLQTRQLSEFASTACKALYQCAHCLEPFDYFKPL